MSWIESMLCSLIVIAIVAAFLAVFIAALNHSFLLGVGVIVALLLVILTIRIHQDSNKGE